MPVIINSDKYRLIFLEDQLEHKIWQGSQGAFLGQKELSSLPADHSSFPNTGGPTRHLMLKSGVHRAFPPLGLRESASPLLLGLLAPSKQKHNPHALQRLEGSASSGCPLDVSRRDGQCQKLLCFSCSCITWPSPATWLLLLSG